MKQKNTELTKQKDSMKTKHTSEVKAAVDAAVEAQEKQLQRENAEAVADHKALLDA